MARIECKSCGKPWMDTKYQRCPKCGAWPGEEGGPPSPTAVETSPDQLSPQAASRSGPSGSATPEVATGDLGLLVQRTDRIISLLTAAQGRTRVDVAARAERVSAVLDVLAGIVLVVGGLAAISGVITIFAGELLTGLGILLVAAFATSLNWSLLVGLSVVAGYVANRS